MKSCHVDRIHRIALLVTALATCAACNQPPAPLPPLQTLNKPRDQIFEKTKSFSVLTGADAYIMKHLNPIRDDPHWCLPNICKCTLRARFESGPTYERKTGCLAHWQL